MSNDMVDGGALDYLPGAPFTDEEVDAAVAAIREALGWHVAVERTETVSFDIGCWQARLLLPTRRLVSVDEVRVNGVAFTAFQVSTSRAQVIKTTGSWLQGYGTVEVDMTHGYDEAPPDLLPVIAETATSQRLLAVRAPVIDNPAPVGEGVGASVVNANALMARTLRQDVLDRYSLTWLPGLA